MNHIEHENSCSGSDQKSISLAADANWKTASKRTCVVCPYSPSFKDASAKVGFRTSWARDDVFVFNSHGWNFLPCLYLMCFLTCLNFQPPQILVWINSTIELCLVKKCCFLLLLNLILADFIWYHVCNATPLVRKLRQRVLMAVSRD